MKQNEMVGMPDDKVGGDGRRQRQRLCRGVKRAEAVKFQAVSRTRGTKSFEAAESAHYPH